MANENIKSINSIANIKNITGESNDFDFDFKSAYFSTVKMMSDMIDTLQTAMRIAESICIREAITREDIMREDIIA